MVWWAVVLEVEVSVLQDVVHSAEQEHVAVHVHFQLWRVVLDRDDVGGGHTQQSRGFVDLHATNETVRRVRKQTEGTRLSLGLNWPRLGSPGCCKPRSDLELFQNTLGQRASAQPPDGLLGGRDGDMWEMLEDGQLQTPSSEAQAASNDASVPHPGRWCVPGAAGRTSSGSSGRWTPLRRPTRRPRSGSSAPGSASSRSRESEPRSPAHLDWTDRRRRRRRRREEISCWRYRGSGSETAAYLVSLGHEPFNDGQDVMEGGSHHGSVTQAHGVTQHQSTRLLFPQAVDSEELQLGPTRDA